MPLVAVPTSGRLLVVPGLGLDARSWRPVLDRLGWPARVLALPAYGVPAADGERLDPLSLARRLVEDVPPRRPGDPPLVLAGHSAGCQVAAHLARLAEDR